MEQNAIKENPSLYIFLAMVFIILSIILITIELQEYYQFFSGGASAPTAPAKGIPTNTTQRGNQ